MNKKTEIVLSEVRRKLAQYLANHSVPGPELADTDPGMKVLLHVLEHPELLLKVALMSAAFEICTVNLEDHITASDEPPGAIAGQMFRIAGL